MQRNEQENANCTRSVRSLSLTGREGINIGPKYHFQGSYSSTEVPQQHQHKPKIRCDRSVTKIQFFFLSPFILWPCRDKLGFKLPRRESIPPQLLFNSIQSSLTELCASYHLATKLLTRNGIHQTRSRKKIWQLPVQQRPALSSCSHCVTYPFRRRIFFAGH